MTSTPLCTVKACPAPSDPFWHICLVCGTSVGIEHQHVDPKRMGGSPSRDVPENIVPLCHGCHTKVTLNEWADKILDYPALGYREYVLRDRDGAVLVRRRLGSDGGERTDGTALRATASVLTPPSAPDLEGETDGGGSLKAEQLVHLRRGPVGAGSIPAPLQPDFADTYLELPEEFRLEDAGVWVKEIARHRRSHQWHAGDLLNALVDRFGDRAYQYDHRDFGYTNPDSLMNVMRTCQRIPRERRYAEIGFTVHARLAGLKVDGELLTLDQIEEVLAQCDSETTVKDAAMLAGWEPAPRVKRWSMEDLQRLAQEFVGPDADVLAMFLDWLEGAE